MAMYAVTILSTVKDCRLLKVLYVLKRRTLVLFNDMSNTHCTALFGFFLAKYLTDSSNSGKVLNIKKK
jgi:hypothetical protein